MFRSLLGVLFGVNVESGVLRTYLNDVVRDIFKFLERRFVRASDVKQVAETFGQLIGGQHVSRLVTASERRFGRARYKGYLWYHECDRIISKVRPGQIGSPRERDPFQSYFFPVFFLFLSFWI